MNTDFNAEKMQGKRDQAGWGQSGDSQPYRKRTVSRAFVHSTFFILHFLCGSAALFLSIVINPFIQ